MKKYFFIGIGGIGMSGLSKVLLEKGEQVFGSDIVSNRQTEELERLGAKIYYQQIPKNIQPDLDFVIVTSAITQDNPELIRAKELGLKIINRSQLLNEVITQQKSIAVTGTHGKTTTSSMIASILEVAGMDPTAVIGAEVHRLSGNAKGGKGEYSVAEVCEYQKAFLDIYPFAAIITNVEEDHLDCYKDLDEIISAFAEFTTHIDKDGLLLVCGEDKNIKKVIANYVGKIIQYGVDGDFDWQATNIQTENQKTTFTVLGDGVEIGVFELMVPGRHNILNALAAITICSKIGVKTKVIKEVLKSFSGASRRFQIMGEIDGVLFIDDYAHHPTEISATLAGARQFYQDKRIIAVFQPHQHSRTKFLLEEFSNSFGDADIVILPEIYAVRDTEDDIKSISSLDLANRINQKTEGKAIFCKDFEEAMKILEKTTNQGDVVMTIGAGPVNTITEMTIKDKVTEN